MKTSRCNLANRTQSHQENTAKCERCVKKYLVLLYNHLRDNKYVVFFLN